MKNTVHKIIILVYTILIVFCLTRLAVLEPNRLAQILEIMLAVATVIKALSALKITFLPNDEDILE